MINDSLIDHPPYFTTQAGSAARVLAYKTMSHPPAVQSSNDADYGIIENAVMETARGRWFLAEFARRNRNADTQVLLATISRLEQSVHDQRETNDIARFRVDLLEMSTAIADTRQQISALQGPDQESSSHFDIASTELDAIVQATASATSDILSSTEQIQDIAWTLRENGIEPAICNTLDTQATNIYTACSFQDLTAQRTRKVIDVLRYVESRINAMIDIWGFDTSTSGRRTNAMEDIRTARHDELTAEELSQSDIDFVLVESVHAQTELSDRDWQQVEQPLPPADASDFSDVVMAEELPVEDAPVEDVPAEATHSEAGNPETPSSPRMAFNPNEASFEFQGFASMEAEESAEAPEPAVASANIHRFQQATTPTAQGLPRLKGPTLADIDRLAAADKLKLFV